MRDPVILPSSRTTIDRATIKSHLLSDATDPFNRMPLSLDNVIPSMYNQSFPAFLRLLTACTDMELKARIDSFLAERRNKNTVYDKPEEDVVHMGASEA